MISISAPTALPATVRSTEAALIDMANSGSVFKDGQTLQMGWMWFKFKEVAGTLCLQVPESGKMPFIWNRDCSAGLNTVMMQKFVNDSFGIEQMECHACQSAILLKGLDRKDGMFMNRLDSLNANDSGWFIGAERGNADVNDPENLERKSLWEISCIFPETLLFWMLPSGWQVVFNDIPVVLKDFQVQQAIPGSLYATRYMGKLR